MLAAFLNVEIAEIVVRNDNVGKYLCRISQIADYKRQVCSTRKNQRTLSFHYLFKSPNFRTMSDNQIIRRST